MFIRAFIGIDFDKRLKDDIYTVQQRLKKYAIKGRWKYADNFHLTIKFLGEINERQKHNIDENMEKLCKTQKSFALKIKGLGIFKGKGLIRVLWLGLEGEIEMLKSLHEEVDNILTPIGFPPENRSFKPHITIGQDIIFENGFENIREMIGEVELGIIQVKNLFLFKSQEIQKKRVYTKVSQYDFERHGSSMGLNY